MSSVAPPAAAAAPALAPMSPFLASRPLAATYGALPPPPASPHASGASDDLIAPPEPAALPARGGPPPSSSHPGAGLPWYGAPAPSYGAPPPRSSLWPGAAYAAPPPQPYTAVPHPPPPHHYYQAPPPSYGGMASSPYGAPAAPGQGASAAAGAGPYAAQGTYGPPAAPDHGALAGASPRSYSSPGAYAMIPHPEMAPSMDPYASLAQAYTAQTAAPPPFYFSHLLPVKLGPDNYLSWRAQVLPLLRSRYLEGYVDGSIPCPPPHHPAYHTWVAQDQAILSAIQSSLTPSV